MENNKSNTSVVISVVVVCLVGVGLYMLSRATPNETSNMQTANSVNNKDGEIINNNPAEEKPVTKDKNMEQIAKNGDILIMNYTGRLTNGTVFDSNVDPKFNHVEPFEFELGAGMVIKGWDEGLLGMKIGEKKTLTISPEKGYGARAVGSIPANSTLIFDVELVAIK